MPEVTHMSLASSIAAMHETLVGNSLRPGGICTRDSEQEQGRNELVVRSSLPLDTLTPSVMGVLRSINPGQPAAEFRPIQSIVDNVQLYTGVLPSRILSSRAVCRNPLAAGLAQCLWRHLSIAVAADGKPAIGIRMALGATRERVCGWTSSRKTLRMATYRPSSRGNSRFVRGRAGRQLYAIQNRNDKPADLRRNDPLLLIRHRRVCSRIYSRVAGFTDQSNDCAAQ